MLSEVAESKEWVSSYEKRDFARITRGFVHQRTAGVLLPGRNPSLMQMEAPGFYPVFKLGRADLKGKLVSTTDEDSDGGNESGGGGAGAGAAGGGRRVQAHPRRDRDDPGSNGGDGGRRSLNRAVERRITG